MSHDGWALEQARRIAAEVALEEALEEALEAPDLDAVVESLREHGHALAAAQVEHAQHVADMSNHGAIPLEFAEWLRSA